MNTIHRVPAGCSYYFIRLSQLKACATNDLRFDSDDEKFANGNYFLSRERCHECATELQEQFAEPLATISNKSEQNRDSFLTAVRNIITAREWDAFPEKEDEIASLKKDELQKAAKGISEMADAYATFEAERKALRKEREEITARVKEIIANFPKI